MPVQTQLQQRRGTAASWTSTNPTLAAGEIGFETDTGKFKIGNGSTAWASLAYSAGATAVTYLFNATGGQTTFSGADANGLTLAYTVGAEQVYLNGVLQVRGSDYTATNGTSIVLASGALVSDVLNVIAYSAMTITDTYTQAQADAKFYQLAFNGAAGKNNIINGALDIWQRGTSIALASNGVGYTADRWYVRNTGSSTVTSRQATNDTTNLPFIQYCLRYSRDSGSTNTAPIYLTQSIESANSIPYAGRTVTYSFYARKGANFSGTVAAQVFSGTGTDQNLINGYTGSTQLLNSAINSTLTTTWQRYTFTFAVGATATELAVHFDWSPSGTAGAADYLEVTGFQLELGSIATPFARAGGTIQGELAACQRYYYASNAGICTAGIAPSGAFIYGRLVHPVPMRTTPSGSISPSGTTFTVTDDYSAAFSSSAVTGFGNDSWITSTSARVSLSGFTGLTGGRFYSVDGRSAGQIMFSAEL